MKIDHVAIWVHNLDHMKQFYETYFQGSSTKKYVNSEKKFESYFVSFTEGCRLELMHKPGMDTSKNDPRKEYTGIVHFSISLGGKEAVDRLTEKLKNDGHEIVDGPRTTGDGYYEAAFLDPEQNRVEIME